jgi:UDP-N-acetylglucosamine 4,6-dehydratase
MTSLLDIQCPKLANIEGETILIFGGSGSLGTTVIQTWINANTIINVSRDEEKQWALRTTVTNTNLKQIVGDISNYDDVASAIIETRPTIICIFACLKHIDLCEKHIRKAIEINTHGIMNVHKALRHMIHGVKKVLFVSTDKACLPITAYGCTKSLAENYLQSIVDTKTKWIGIRYGNVLNSSGSIIPYLRKNKVTAAPYTLTHPEMTRFIMTLQHSVNLIEYALTFGKSNEIIIPKISSMNIKDLFELFCEKYDKTYTVTGLRCKEKIHEDLLSKEESEQSYLNGQYIHVTTKKQSGGVEAFDSSTYTITKDGLKEYLEVNELL